MPDKVGADVWGAAAPHFFLPNIKMLAMCFNTQTEKSLCMIIKRGHSVCICKANAR